MSATPHVDAFVARHARDVLVPHLHRLAAVYETARSEYEANRRSPNRRTVMSRARGEVVGMLVALSAVDGLYGEGYQNTARRYGLEIWP